MKIDWKSLCKTPGYISLKKAVVENIAKRHRSKKQTYQMFYATINRAKHYAHFLNKPLEEILNEWEEKRLGAKYPEWIIQFYPGHFRERNRLPKLNNAPNVKRPGVKHYTKSNSTYKKDPVKRKARSLSIIMGIQKAHSKRKGDKARWPKHRKESYKHMKKYEKEEALKKASA